MLYDKNVSCNLKSAWFFAHTGLYGEIDGFT